MKPIDFLLVGIVLLIAVTAAFCIYKSKKSGKKCIGCPYSNTCNKRDCT